MPACLGKGKTPQFDSLGNICLVIKLLHFNLLGTEIFYTYIFESQNNLLISRPTCALMLLFLANLVQMPVSLHGRLPGGLSGRGEKRNPGGQPQTKPRRGTGPPGGEEVSGHGLAHSTTGPDTGSKARGSPGSCNGRSCPQQSQQATTPEAKTSGGAAKTNSTGVKHFFSMAEGIPAPYKVPVSTPSTRWMIL